MATDKINSARAGTLLGSDFSLRISEIFCSLQGESSQVGLPTTFVRLTGCPLRCHYCDTAYAFSGGEVLAVDDILATLADYAVPNICVTGGEPLAQKQCLPFLSLLCNHGYRVSLETSGAMDISAVDPRVKRIVDLKTPSSGEVDKNCYDNMAQLRRQDEVKFVIGDSEDYRWAMQQVAQYNLPDSVENILFSPVFSVEDKTQTSAAIATELADWIVADRAPVRMQLQLHKLIWGDKPGV